MNSSAQIAELALRLVRIPSWEGDESGVAAQIAAVMAEAGLEVEVDPIGNVIGRLHLGPGPTILLDGHLDTVGPGELSNWTRSPTGEMGDGRLWGRGSVDMKGPLAAAVRGVAALRDTPASGTVVLSATLAEELVEGACLTPVLERVGPDAVVICEATDLHLATGQRGRLELVVETLGRATHTSRPELGVNAAEVMADVMRALRSIATPVHPVLGPGVLVLSDVISSPYPGLSVVPDRCRATFDRRTLPGEREDEVIAAVRASAGPIAEAASADLRVSVGVDAFRTYTGHAIDAPNFAAAWHRADDDQLVEAAMHGLREVRPQSQITHYDFCTNGSAAAAMGIPVLGFGPGDNALAHQPDENVALEDLDAAAGAYTSLVQALLAALA